jgi:predicted transcriptional regulator
MDPLDFNETFFRKPVQEVIGLLKQYIDQCYPSNKHEAARQIRDGMFCSTTEGEDSDEKPCLRDVADFMAAVGPSPTPLAVGLIGAQKLTLLSGLPKQGKSLLGLDILDCVSAAEPVMQRFSLAAAAPVVYFAFEDGEHEVKERLLTRGITARSNFHTCCVSFDMSTSAGFDTFEELIDTLPQPPGLVVIDTFREAYRSIRDFNDAAQVGPALSPLRRWAHKNCAVILVVHSNKNSLATGISRVSGSNALVSSADAYIVLDDQKVLENGDLRWKLDVGGRGLKQAAYVIEMDTNTLHFRVLDKDEMRLAQAQTTSGARKDLHQAVARVVNEAGETTPAKIATAIGESYDFTKKLVREMELDGQISKTGRSEEKTAGAGRRACTYQLTQRGKELISDAALPIAIGPSTINSDDENDAP